MTSLLYRLDTPHNDGSATYQHVNIFRIDMETKRNNALFEPHLSMYLAACDPTGSEIRMYNEQGKKMPMGSAFVRLKFNDLTVAQKLSHQNLMQSLYEYLQTSNLLNAGTIVESAP